MMDSIVDTLYRGKKVKKNQGKLNQLFFFSVDAVMFSRFYF